MPTTAPYLHAATDIDQVIAAIWAIFQRRGQEAYHGEPVSQLEHAVQCAQRAAQYCPGDAEFVLAAFLHDLGHICAPPEITASMDGFGAVSHEIIGAQYLRTWGFSEKIVGLVAGHVQAKRYLVSTDPAYYAALSEASKITLEKQGGRMSAEECRAFEQDFLFEQHLALRRLDEQAKAPDQPIGELDWLDSLLRGHLHQRLRAVEQHRKIW